MHTDLALALALADLADAITLDRFQALDLRVETKADATPVTDADRATEMRLRAELAAQRPDDAIIGEEYGSTDAANARQWIIDPIDGTQNFMRGVPVWATLIALAVDGVPVVGVVSAPALGRRWFAALGEGAHVRDARGQTRISVSAVADLEHASISYADFKGWEERGIDLHTLLRRCWRTRAYGDFWSHMMVAEGIVDIAPEPSLAKWDMAALDIIVREAGGRFSGIDGVDGIHQGSGVSTNGLLHDVVIAHLT
jgi:histidinol-phosphatase